jgi:hypothetical protein
VFRQDYHRDKALGLPVKTEQDEPVSSVPGAIKEEKEGGWRTLGFHVCVHPFVFTAATACLDSTTNTSDVGVVGPINDKQRESRLAQSHM